MDFESVVVGAGPAGCLAARDLAGAGARVAIVDGSHPREKICGGGVTFHALAALTLAGLRTHEAAHAVNAAVFEANGRQARVPLERADVLNVFPRAALDRWVLSGLITPAVLAHAEAPPIVDPIMAFRAFEAWYEAERGAPFLQVFERYVPPTPLVEF